MAARHWPRLRLSKMGLGLVFAVMVLLAATTGCTRNKQDDRRGVTPSETATRAERTAPLLEGMGDLHWKVTTDSDLAQRYFDQGSDGRRGDSRRAREFAVTTVLWRSDVGMCSE